MPTMIAPSSTLPMLSRLEEVDRQLELRPFAIAIAPRMMPACRNAIRTKMREPADRAQQQAAEEPCATRAVRLERLAVDDVTSASGSGRIAAEMKNQSTSMAMMITR